MAQVGEMVNHAGSAIQWRQIEAALRLEPAIEIPAAGRTRAAVAMILKNRAASPKLLFMERARHDHDPWSGDIGFPGGKLENGDPGPRQAAERETAEEVGLDLAGATCLGRLDDIAGATLPVVVSCFVYGLEGDPELFLSREVERAFWVPLAQVLDPGRRCEAPVRFQGRRLTRPAIRLPVPGYDIVWGISYRLLTGLCRKLPSP